ncbi:MAG: hypothetical protein IJY31_04145 [Muribaculaceae bacterium]|nr:hypothetical protein [Muribaculaceae bacterium]
MKKLMIVAAVALTVTACGNKADKSGEQHVEEAVAECGHEHAHHGHEMAIAGIAQGTDTVAGQITIVKLSDGETQTFDYASSNPDKIAAWQAGDTVTVFVHHHHHGDVAHDSIAAVKIGNYECRHEHGTCDGHDHGHHDHDHAH